ncbi:hypothetical protein CRG98_001166 [Punica granatum]|uniref:Uncharacterized protein n=1 Tax=Punica granatum TaxID=22663 RepID=A0A2I0LCP5_PUNGR|nr:hypothetical protein CRG98_001166 [Punica granatum]
MPPSLLLIFPQIIHQLAQGTSLVTHTEVAHWISSFLCRPAAQASSSTPFLVAVPPLSPSSATDSLSIATSESSEVAGDGLPVRSPDSSGAPDSSSSSSSSSEAKAPPPREPTAVAALRKASCMESSGRAQSSRPASSRRGGRISARTIPEGSTPSAASVDWNSAAASIDAVRSGAGRGGARLVVHLIQEKWGP